MVKGQDQKKDCYGKYNPPITFKVGNFFLLSKCNLQLPGLKKLTACFVRPCETLARIGSQAYHLKLSLALCHYHLMFHISLLELVPPNTIC